MDITLTQRFTHEQLALDREWLALEAEHSTSINFSDLIHRFLPNARGILAGLVSRFQASEEGIVLSRDQRAFMKVVDEHKYLDLSPIVAYVPEGLDTTYQHYANVLGAAVDHAVKVQTLLTDYSTYIASLLTNHDVRFSNQDSSGTYKGLEAQRAQLNLELGKCFRNGSHNTEVRYGDVVERNSDWSLVFHAAAQLTDKMNGVNRKVLAKTLQDTSHLMDRLIEMAKKDDFKGASPTMLSELADGAFQLASEVEFFAVIYYRVLALSTAIDSTTKNILKLRA